MQIRLGSQITKRFGVAFSGQSTVEFALTLILSFSFILFFLKIANFFAFGNYVHYATFMSARAYLSAGANQNDQKTRAQDVIIYLLKKSAGQASLDKFPMIAKGVQGDDGSGFASQAPSQYSHQNQDYSWLQGIRYTFQGSLFLLPLGGAKQSSNNQVQLTSESWLNRETTDEECQQYMRSSGWLFDNGC